MREYDEPDDDDDWPLGSIRPFPAAVRIAGTIWIAMGVLIFVGTGGILLLLLPATIAGGGCLMIFGGFTGVVFVAEGAWTLQGTAKGTGGNGAGSIFIALIFLCVGFFLARELVLQLPREVTDHEKLTQMLALAVTAVSGLGLLTAGVLALVGRKAYAAWREAGASAGTGRPAP
jgi:hypothetical protein